MKERTDMRGDSIELKIIIGRESESGKEQAEKSKCSYRHENAIRWGGTRKEKKGKTEQ